LNPQPPFFPLLKPISESLWVGEKIRKVKPMKILHYVDERGWGYACALEKGKIIATLEKKFKIDFKLAELILNAYLDALRGELTVYQEEFLRHHKNVTDFLDTLVEEIDEETAKRYFNIN